MCPFPAKRRRCPRPTFSPSPSVPAAKPRRGLRLNKGLPCPPRQHGFRFSTGAPPPRSGPSADPVAEFPTPGEFHACPEAIRFVYGCRETARCANRLWTRIISKPLTLRNRATCRSVVMRQPGGPEPRKTPATPPARNGWRGRGPARGKRPSAPPTAPAGRSGFRAARRPAPMFPMIPPSTGPGHPYYRHQDSRRPRRGPAPRSRADTENRMCPTRHPRTVAPERNSTDSPERTKSIRKVPENRLHIAGPCAGGSSPKAPDIANMTRRMMTRVTGGGPAYRSPFTA